MDFSTALRKDCVTVNVDGTYTVKGSGWFWVRIGKDGVSVLELAPDMLEKTSARLFITKAKRTVQKHFFHQ
mgnify:FL=1